MLAGTKQKLRGITLPLALALARARVAPNLLTAAGLVIAACAGLAVALGHLLLGFVLLVASALCDVLDGDVARHTPGRVSRFGAFLDSTSDRVSEAFILGGLLIGQAFHGGGFTWLWVLLWLLAFSGSFLVSYTRARAEGLGLSCQVGFADRTLRLGLVMVMLIVGFRHSAIFLAVIGLLAWFTVGQRVTHVWRQAERAAEPPSAGTPRA
jgi:CDP-diacylglycerol--glycerol-3-phosphate 3-phosphatidyltransferase